MAAVPAARIRTPAPYMASIGLLEGLGPGPLEPGSRAPAAAPSTSRRLAYDLPEHDAQAQGGSLATTLTARLVQVLEQHAAATSAATKRPSGADAADAPDAEATAAVTAMGDGGAAAEAAAVEAAALETRVFEMVASALAEACGVTANENAALAVHGLRAELESLRRTHAQELEAVRSAADEEQQRMRSWCERQLEAIEGNRDAVLGAMAERREEVVSTHALQLAELQSDHKKQAATYRRLLADEQQRCAAARSEVLRVSIESGNERLALRAKLRRQRDRDEARVAALEAQLHEQRSAAAARESELLARLGLAERTVAQLEEVRLALGVPRACHSPRVSLARRWLRLGHLQGWLDGGLPLAGPHRRAVPQRGARRGSDTPSSRRTPPTSRIAHASRRSVRGRWRSRRNGQRTSSG